MRIFDLILWTLVNIIGGSYFAAKYNIQESHTPENFLKEDFIIGMIAVNIVFIGLGVAAYFIAKSKKAKQPYKIALISSSIAIGMIAIQTFFN